MSAMKSYLICKSVLIDTWWNVNYDRLACRKEAFEVLIDTWWNVN